LLALAELDSTTWVSEVKRIRGKKQPLLAAPLALRFLLSAFPFQLFRPPARALAAETLTLERELNVECRM
jgi:hypothetical protein